MDYIRVSIHSERLVAAVAVAVAAVVAAAAHRLEKAKAS